MSTETVEAPEDKKLQELQARMTGKEKPEQAKMLRAFMQEQYGVQQEEQPTFILSDEQIRIIASGAADVAKDAIKDEITKTESRYGMNATQSLDVANDAVSKEIRRQANYYRDMEMAAEGFRAISRKATSSAASGEVESFRERETKYLKDTGREVRAITAGTGSAGGYMAPETWNTAVYENLQRVSFLRRFGRWMPMPEGNGGIMRLPKLSSNVTAQSPAELGATTPSQVTLAQATWTLKKLAVLSNPISIELLYEATPNVVDMLVQWATIELNRKEDEVTFNTTDSQWSGSYLLGSNTNVVTLGAGKTALTDVTFDDMGALIFQLAEQYVPDADVQGSGAVTGQAGFWMNKAVMQQLLKLKGTDNGYLWGEVSSLAANRQIYGYNAHRTISMPSTATTGQKFMAFGNLGYMWVAYRPGFFIDIMDQGIVNSTNLNENFGYSVRIGEMLDIQRIDDNALAILKTA